MAFPTGVRCGRFTHQSVEIDSSIKEGAGVKTAQEANLLWSCTCYPSWCSAVCPGTICHSVAEVPDRLRLRSLFQFCCI
jgi:hypothetical protein